VNLLVISFYYTPAISPRAFRWSAVAEEWVRRGHRVTVISSVSPGDPREEVLNGVRVLRVGGRLSEAVRTRFGSPSALRPRAAAEAVPAPASAPGRRRALRHVAKWVHDRTWKKVYWPDFACLWYPAARDEALRVAEEEGVDGLVTVSLPFSGHMAGLPLKRRDGALPWLVDIGDPFAFFHRTPLNNHALYRRRNDRAESTVLRLADVVSVTTEPTLERYVEMFPHVRGKIRVVPPLLVPPDVEPAPRDPVPLRLVFVGTLFRRFRSPAFLLELFHALEGEGGGRPMELHFYGDLHDCAPCFEPYAGSLGQRVFLHGAVPRTEAYAAMLSADVLVNIGNDTEYQLPSKVVDYASTGRPVVNVVRTPADNSARFFGRYPAALTLVDEGTGVNEAQLSAVRAFVARHAGRRVPPPELAWLGEFGLESITDAYEGMLMQASEVPA
jgi:glycosyltransferase involved in cell wall biosynthesis